MVNGAMRIAKKTISGVTAPSVRLTMLGAALVAGAIALSGGGALMLIDWLWL